MESWNCTYIPYGSGWKAPYELGWNASTALQPVRAASFDNETQRLTCVIPDDLLHLQDNQPWAEVDPRLSTRIVLA